jgi:predicted PurR-regulated permease PerM
MPRSEPQPFVLELPWRTILKVLAAAALVWVWLHTWHIFLLVVVAVLLAVTLDPLVRRLEARRLPRWLAASIVVFGLLGVLIAFGVFTSQSLPSQGKLVASRLGEVQREVAGHVPAIIRDALGARDAGELAQTYAGPFVLRVTSAVMTALVVILLAFVLTLYLLIEGRHTYQWMLAFVPTTHRRKVAETAVESQRVIFGYVAGNIATSVFATVFALISLTLLDVPAALLLAVVAGLCDFVPVLGFIVSALPAFVIALGRSPAIAFTVLALYVAYHALENYFIGPWVYGDRLRLSNVAVVLAFAVGAAVGGVVGALVALPIAAAYPAIERIWLRDRLGDRVVKEHAAIQEARET